MKDISLMYVVQFYLRVKHKKSISKPDMISLDSQLNKIKMPLPKPEKNEDKTKFLDRCIKNNTIKTEYPDINQRIAVCNTQWKNK